MYNSVVVYQINLTWLAHKLSVLPTELDIFDIRQHCVRILSVDRVSQQNYYISLGRSLQDIEKPCI